MIIRLESLKTNETIVLADVAKVYEIPTSNEFALVANPVDGEPFKRALVFSHELFTIERKQDV